MVEEPAPLKGEQETMDALRRWGNVFGEFGRLFGTRQGMHVTDAVALIHVVQAEDGGMPLTQSVLSRRIGLSSGATSSLLNRLETAGHIERRRDSSDRRVVTVRSTTAVHREVDEFFAPVGHELTEIIGRYPPEMLRQLTDLVNDMAAAMDRHLEHRQSAD